MKLLWTKLWMLSCMGLLAPAAWAVGPTLKVGDIADLDLARMSEALGDPNGGPERPVYPRRISLEEALEVALQENLRIQVAAIDVDFQTPEVYATRAKFHPTIGAEGAAVGINEEIFPELNNRDFQTARAFVRQELPTGGLLTFGGDYVNDEPVAEPSIEQKQAFVEVRQPLMRGGRVFVARRFIYDAEYDLEIQKARLEAEILDVTAQTKIAYYNLVLARRLIQVVEAAIEKDKQLLEASNALFDAGRVTKRDVVSAEIQLSKNRIDLASRQGAEESAQNALRDILGTPINLYLEVTDREIPFQPIDLQLDEWIDLALRNRPEILELQKRLEKADLEVRVRKNDVLPILDIFGSYRDDISSGNDNYDWRVAGLFEIPFGNVAARSRLASARAARHRVEREYAQLQRQIEVQVRQIEINLRENTRRLRDLIEGVEQARAKREIATARFELGQADNLDVTDAQEDLVNAESDLLRAVVDYANNVALLEARIGTPL